MERNNFFFSCELRWKTGLITKTVRNGGAPTTNDAVVHRASGALHCPAMLRASYHHAALLQRSQRQVSRTAKEAWHHKYGWVKLCSLVRCNLRVYLRCVQQMFSFLGRKNAKWKKYLEIRSQRWHFRTSLLFFSKARIHPKLCCDLQSRSRGAGGFQAIQMVYPFWWTHRDGLCQDH